MNDDSERQDWDKGEHGVGVQDESHREAEVLAATEALLRYVLGAHPDIALVLIEGFCYATWTLDVRQRLGHLYGVPVIPARDLYVGRDCRSNWRGSALFKHQPRWAHERIAHGLRAWWCYFQQHVMSLAPGPIKPLPVPIALETLRDRFIVCEVPLSVYDPKAPVTLPNVVSGNWTLFADRPEKPGWISEGNKSTIDFPLKFGASPRIMIVFTQGYEGFDDAWVSMPNQSKNILTLQGRHRSHVTQSELFVINAQQDANEQLVGGIKGFGVQPHSEQTLRIQQKGMSNKVKITWVSSC